MNMNNFSFMTIGAAKASTDGNASFKKYVGVGVVKVLAVNPTKAQIKELAGYEVKEEPVYHGTQEVDGKQVPFARVTFLLKTTPEKCNGVDTTYQLSYFIRGDRTFGANSGKWQVVDGFGNTAWADEATIKSNSTVMYSNGPAKLIGPYHPAFIGEVALVQFIKEYLNLGTTNNNGFAYIDGAYTPKKGDELEMCKIGFSEDEIRQMFAGNFSAVKDAIALVPNNEIKVVFGVRTDTASGAEYQDVYTKVVRNSAKNVDVISKEIEDSKANGGLSNRYYEYTPIHEYTITATNFEETPTASDPFAAADPWA